MERDAAQVEHGQQVAGADFVLQGEAQHVEVRERSEGLQAVERQLGGAQLGFHVGPGGEDALAGPIGPAVHQRVENLQAMMAHADRVGVGKRQAEPAADVAMILDHRVQLAPQILGRHLHPRQDVTDEIVFERLIEHV